MDESAARKLAKHLLGWVVSKASSRCEFSNTIFMMGHMRSGSTALMNVLCSHEEISGFGESHIAYKSKADLGILVLSQLKHQGVRRRRRHLCDKILHTRLDRNVPEEFYSAKAIFCVRPPAQTVLSILNLSRKLNWKEFDTAEKCADYYEKRIEQLLLHWEKFLPENRIGMTTPSLLSDPDSALQRIEATLRLTKPLKNSYQARKIGSKFGVGDPLMAVSSSMIVRRDEEEGNFPDKDSHVMLPFSRQLLLSNMYESYRKAVSQNCLSDSPPAMA